MNLLSLISLWLDIICQVTTKRATVTFHPTFRELNAACVQLQFLHLHFNSFTGQLPDHVGNQSAQLFEFEVGYNRLTGGLLSLWKIGDYQTTRLLVCRASDRIWHRLKDLDWFGPEIPYVQYGGGSLLVLLEPKCSWGRRRWGVTTERVELKS